MFTGFTDETFEFFTALRFNNNREFFNANRGWYERAVRVPLLELCAALEPCMLAIDSGLDTRPSHAVSRIIRDMRYVRGAPYRDYVWIGFHTLGLPKSECFSLYFDISDSDMDVGAGLFNDNRPWMNCLRAAIRTQPETVLEAFTAPDMEQFALHGEAFKRIATPPELPPLLHELYIKKGFYLEYKYESLSAGHSAALVDDIAAKFEALAPLYRLMNEWKGAYASDNP